MSINWDVVTMQAKRKSKEYADLHPNHTVEAAFYQGYMENAAERESLRAINERLQNKQPEAPAPALLSMADFL